MAEPKPPRPGEGSTEEPDVDEAWGDSSSSPDESPPVEAGRAKTIEEAEEIVLRDDAELAERYMAEAPRKG